MGEGIRDWLSSNLRLAACGVRSRSCDERAGEADGREVPVEDACEAVGWATPGVVFKAAWASRNLDTTWCMWAGGGANVGADEVVSRVLGGGGDEPPKESSSTWPLAAEDDSGAELAAATAEAPEEAVGAERGKDQFEEELLDPPLYRWLLLELLRIWENQKCWLSWNLKFYKKKKTYVV